MKAKTVVFLVFLIATKGCKAQDNTKNTAQMKTFDIETFNKNKNHLNEYFFITDDSTVVEQRKMQYDYYEIIKQKKSYFQTRNRYYENGKLKSTVQDFPNDFLAGIMKEYDEQGNLIKETDYDAPYKFTWEDVLAFIKKRGIDMDNYYLEITRDVVEGQPYWGITYEKEDKTGLIHIGMDANNGKIVQDEEFDYPGLD